MRYYGVRLNEKGGTRYEGVTAASYHINGDFITFYDDDGDLVAVFSAHTLISITT